MEELQVKHPRNTSENGDPVPFSTCSTNIGCWGCCKSCRQSDINAKLGPGVAIYFKQVKFLAMLFYVFTLFNIPAFFLYINGGEQGI